VEPAGLLQAGAVLALNAGFAWLTGSFLFRLWLGRPDVALLAPCARALRVGERVAASGCIAGVALSLWGAAALMADVPLADALSMLPDVALHTSVGRAALAALGCALLMTVPALHGSMRAALLLAFALARAAGSHAGGQGLVSVSVAIEWMHLLLMAVWLGGVALAAWLVLPLSLREGRLLGTTMDRLSQTATVALGGIVMTGIFNAWQRLSGVQQLVDNPYGMALSVKLALVAMAVILGAYNRFMGFPRLARGRGAAALLVLRVESIVLLCALAAAAVLTGQAPPG
jgi:putative copper resistance protein D